MTTKRSLLAVGTAFLLLLVIGVAQAVPAPTARADDDDDDSGRASASQIRRVELARLPVFVGGDVAAARRFLAEDFRGINPLGISATRDEFLAGMAGGAPDFLAMQPTTPIEVDVYGKRALVRYQMRIELTIFGLHLEHLMWETLLYERERGQWRIAWEQTTAVPNDIGLVIEALKKP